MGDLKLDKDTFLKRLGILNSTWKVGIIIFYKIKYNTYLNFCIKFNNHYIIYNIQNVIIINIMIFIKCTIIIISL